MDWFLYDNGLRHERVKTRNRVNLPNHGISSQMLGLKYNTEHIPRKTLWISGIINLDL